MPFWPCREYLEGARILNVSHRVQKLPDGTVALPVLEGKLTKQHLQDLRGSMAPGTTCILSWIKVRMVLAILVWAGVGFTMPVPASGCFFDLCRTALQRHQGVLCFLATE